MSATQSAIRNPQSAFSAVAPNTPTLPPPVRRRVPNSAIEIPPIALPKIAPLDLAHAAPRSEFELIMNERKIVAVLIPRELTQSQLLIVERLTPAAWTQQEHLATQWKQWRVYAPSWWTREQADTAPKPAGTKLYFG